MQSPAKTEQNVIILCKYKSVNQTEETQLGIKLIKVAIKDLYLQRIITFGSVLAGLCTGAGSGLLGLFQQNKSIKQTFIILTSLYLLRATIRLMFHNMIGGSLMKIQKLTNVVSFSIFKYI